MGQNFITVTQEYLADLFSENSTPLSVTDPQGTILYVNAAYTALTGYSLTEIAGKNIRDLTDPKRASFYDSLYKKFSKDNVWTGTILSRRKNGERFWERCTLTPLLGNLDGKYCVANHEDITMEVEMDRRFQNSYDMLLSINDSIGSIVYVADINTYEILYLNLQGRQLLGNPDNTKCYFFMYGENKPCEHCNMEYLSSHHSGNKATDFYEEREFNSLGMWMSLNSKIIEWIDGRKVRLTIGQDITKRVAMSQKLQESTELFRALAASASRMITLKSEADIIQYTADILSSMVGGNLVFMVEPSPSHLGFQIIHATKAGKNPFFEIESIVGVDIRNISFTVPGRIEFLFSGANFLEYLPGVHGLLKSTFSEEITENLIKHFNANIVYGVGVYGGRDLLIGALVISAEKINTDNTVPLQTVLYQTSTALQRKRLENSLREETKRAEEASQAKSRFLAMVSHEIRTPLNAVLGMLELTLQTSITEEQRDYLTTARDSSQHLVRVINDVLDFSKMEAREIELESIDFNIHHLLKNAHRTFLALASTKGLFLKLEIDPSLDSYYNGDEIRIRQIVFNLTGNAIKFTEKGGVTIRAKEESGWILIDIIDTGIGIPKEKHNIIFESFKQSDLSHTRKYGGTGLGLSISQRLANLMGGNITVDSEPGLGTTFTVIIPAKKTEAPIAETAFKGPPFLQTIPLHILLVEDNVINQKIAKLALEKFHNTLDIAENGAVALEMLRKNRYDLVIMDAEMPVMDGLEATRRIRRGEAGTAVETIPIVGMSAHALSEFKTAALEAGMDDYITKPIDINTVQERLEAVFTRKYRVE